LIDNKTIALCMGSRILATRISFFVDIKQKEILLIIIDDMDNII